MRKVRAWGLAATLMMGLSAAVAVAADDDAESTPVKPPAKAPTWQWKPFAGWFGSKAENKAAAKKPSSKSEPTVAKKPTAPVKPASIVDEAAAQRGREEVALLRRLQACDKLKEIALRNNDHDLLSRAEELEERAQTAYAQRTAHLRDGAGSFESDEKTIDQFLGAGKGRSAETSAYTVHGTDRSSRAAVEEVKP
jgi:hypothetical protein